MQIPYTVEMRPDTGLTNGRLAMWLFLASEAMLFGALFSSYFILRAGASDWTPPAMNLVGASANTAVLIASSVTISRAWAALKANNWSAHRRLLAVTISLGVVFLAIKSFEYREHLSRQEYPSHSTFLALYYTLTGFHALHIVGGLLVMMYLLVAGPALQRHSASMLLNRVENIGLYWHFVDVVWLIVFSLLYLF